MKMNFKILLTVFAALCGANSFGGTAWIENLRNNYSEMLIARTSDEGDVKAKGRWIKSFPVSCVQRRNGDKAYQDNRSTRIGCYPFVIQSGQALVFDNMQVPWKSFGDNTQKETTNAFFITTWQRTGLLGTDVYQMIIYRIQEDDNRVVVSKSIDNGKTFTSYGSYDTDHQYSVTLNAQAELVFQQW